MLLHATVTSILVLDTALIHHVVEHCVGADTSSIGRNVLRSRNNIMKKLYCKQKTAAHLTQAYIGVKLKDTGSS